MDVNHALQTFAIYALPVLFAITLHEAAHGYVARHFGDMTAHAQGRISLNPLRHIDLLGTVVVPIAILLVSGGKFLFGWAKPVPVNFSALKKPRQHMAWVAAAGPAANLVMAILWVAVLRICVTASDRADAWADLAREVGTGGLVDVVLKHGNGPAEFLIGMAAAGVMVNLIFMLLNLVPIPPLDGGRILTSLLPSRAAWRFAKIEPWGLPILLVLLFTNVLAGVLGPLVFESEALLRAVVLL
ncbi:MAG TPA: site-2 protease family protein [Burkholderiales bacterium]|nr:site-2 protease family protein [Burkholderiales bacterium]